MLLSAIGKREVPIPEHIDIHHLTREMSPSEKTPLQCVMEVDTERAMLEREAERLAHEDGEAAGTAGRLPPLWQGRGGSPSRDSGAQSAPSPSPCSRMREAAGAVRAAGGAGRGQGGGAGLPDPPRPGLHAPHAEEEPEGLQRRLADAGGARQVGVLPAWPFWDPPSPLWANLWGSPPERRPLS